MSRPRKPDEILEKSGAWKHDPQRRRTPPPKNSKPIGNAPPHFTKEEKAIWKEFLSMIPENVLTQNDRWAAELICKLMNKFRNGAPLLGTEMSQLINLMGRFGMTPADRSKITAVKKNDGEEENPDAEFIN